VKIIRTSTHGTPFVRPPYIPLIHGEDLVGALEVLCFGGEATAEAVETLVDVSDAAAASLTSAQQYETERNDSLSSITRPDAALRSRESILVDARDGGTPPARHNQFQEILNCQAVNTGFCIPTNLSN